MIVEDHQEVRTFIRQYLEADYAVIEAVEKNLGDEEFSVEDLGREAGKSRVQLHRKLKALINQSAANSFSPCACSGRLIY